MPNPARRWSAYKRIPPFVPVPLRSRRDGWTPVRQGEFIGWLAETGSVAEAAARVGCSRESAYRLRRLEGGQGFALAWEVALGAEAPLRKFTPDEAARAAFSGVVQVLMRRGRYRGCRIKAHNSALLRFLSRYDRMDAEPWWEEPMGEQEATHFARLVSTLERRFGA